MKSEFELTASASGSRRIAAYTPGASGVTVTLPRVNPAFGSAAVRGFGAQAARSRAAHESRLMAAPRARRLQHRRREFSMVIVELAADVGQQPRKSGGHREL